MALTDLVLDCKFYRKNQRFLYKKFLLVYEMTNVGRVDMRDFELLKVLGTGGKLINLV